MELCVLASGSAGNCTLLRACGQVMMIDCGIGPRTAAKRMNGTGVSVADIRAICLTHLDSDHVSPHWAATILRHGIRIYCHAGRREQLLSMMPAEIEPLVVSFEDEGVFEPMEGVGFNPLHLAHDQSGSHGFVIEGMECRFGFATDLGRVPMALLEAFVDLDLIALEANYDPVMQESSARPMFLKRRIMGGNGHLSNEQAIEALRLMLDRAQASGRRLPDHIVLLHRSRQCNCPKLLRRMCEADPRLAVRVTLAEQYARSEWLRKREVAPAFGEQLRLAF